MLPRPVSIRFKLAVAFVFLSAVGVGLTLGAAYVAVRESEKSQIGHELGRTLSLLQQQVQTLQSLADVRVKASFDQIQFVSALSQANAEDAELGLAEPGRDLESFRKAHDTLASADLPLLADYDILLIVNKRGNVLLNRGSATMGEALGESALIKHALGGGGVTDLWSGTYAQGFSPTLLTREAGGDLFLVRAEPIAPGGHLIGAVLVGQRASVALLPLLESLSGGSVALQSMDGAVLAKSAGIRESAPHVPGGAPVLIKAEGAGYLAERGNLTLADGKAIGRAILLRPFDAPLKEFLNDFRRSMLLPALGVLLLVIFLTRFLARRLSAPLVRLGEAAREVSQGNLDIEVQASGGDEVGKLGTAFNEMVTGLRQRDQIKSLFKLYLNPQVVDELIKHPEKASPGGERRMLTVVFSDLVGFTTFAEKISPEDLVSLLNRYFEDSMRVLKQRDGSLDKFMGDAIMCFWNAPLLQDDHAARACLTALDFLAVVDALAPEFAQRGVAPFDCRIGINTGPCVVGTIGSTDTRAYTALGDAVNLASRLEGAAKIYGTRTLITAETLKAAGDSVVARELDFIRVKGRELPVRVYELLGPEGTRKPAYADTFARGLYLYRSKRFVEARDRFESNKSDPPSRVFRDRCVEYIEAPPPDDWDAVFTLDTK